MTVPVSEESGFQYEPEAIQKKLTPQTRAILINSPANPTGTLLSPDRMRRIAELSPYIISDEIYHGLEYAEPAQTALGFTRQAIVVNSFSKYYAMTGWRLGYAAPTNAAVPTYCSWHPLHNH